MIRIAHLYKNYYLGISFIGIIAFAVQEIPYIIMPLVKPEPNPIMNMQKQLKWIQTLQRVLGMLSMVLLMLLVRDDVSFFSIEKTRDKAFFILTLLMILINFIGWAFYYSGHHFGRLIVVSQFAVVPLYYLCFGLWKYNYPLVMTAAVFFAIHTVNGYMNFIAKE